MAKNYGVFWGFNPRATTMLGGASGKKRPNDPLFGPSPGTAQSHSVLLRTLFFCPHFHIIIIIMTACFSVRKSVTSNSPHFGEIEYALSTP